MSKQGLINRRSGVLVLALALALLALPAGPALAQAKVLKFSHSWTKGDIRDNWAVNFAKLVEERTKGSVKFELHPGAVLFKPKAQLDAIRKGALDMCIWPLGWSSGRNQKLALPELPGLIRNPEEGALLARSEAGRMLNQEAEKTGFKILSWGWLPVSIGSKEKPVVVPADAKGLKMRGAVKPMEMTLQQAGAAITKMPSSEVYMALQTGTLDALMTTNASFYSFRLYDVLKHLTMGKKYSIFLGLFNIIIGPDAFASLSPEEQKIMEEVAVETEKAFQAEVDGATAKCEKAFRDAGATVVDLTAEQIGLWREEAKESAWKWYQEKVKGGSELLELALKAQ